MGEQPPEGLGQQQQQQQQRGGLDKGVRRSLAATAIWFRGLGISVGRKNRRDFFVEAVSEVAYLQ